jgi:hypothetical protein
VVGCEERDGRRGIKPLCARREERRWLTAYVILNMSGEKEHVRFNLAPLKLTDKAQTMLTTMHGMPKELALADVELEPFAVFIGRVDSRCCPIRRTP